MTTAVSGGTGFVGSNIVRMLAERGHRVVSLDITPPNEMVLKYLDPWKAQIDFVEVDILDTDALDSLARSGRMDGVDRFIHAAVWTSTLPETERDEGKRIIDVNVGCTINLLEMASRISAERFLYVSSGGVYRGQGGPGKVLTEDLPLLPSSYYGVTKFASEGITKRYGELHELETVSVRLSTPYGPMERATDYRLKMGMLYDWTRSVVRGEPVHVAAEVGFIDWMFATDKAEGIITVSDAPVLEHSMYNITQGDPTSLAGLMDAFRQAEPSVTFTGPGADGQSPLVDTGQMDVSRLHSLGFRPKYDIVSGVAEYIRWRREFPFLD